MKPKTQAQSFVVTIVNNDENIWQGDISWIDENKTQSFRSALELMNLINSAVSEDNDEE